MEQPPISIRRRLTLWILAALSTFLVIDTTVIYQNTLQSINVAYDRTLLASARAIGDTVRFDDGKLTSSLPYATLEVFEAVTRGRIVYRVNDFEGGFLTGYPELPPHDGVFPKRAAYAALSPGGVLAVWSSFPNDKFTARLRTAGFVAEEIAIRATGKRGGARHVIWIATRPAS